MKSELDGRFDGAGLAVPFEEKIAAAKELERLVREADRRVQTVRSASFS